MCILQIQLSEYFNFVVFWSISRSSKFYALNQFIFEVCACINLTSMKQLFFELWSGYRIGDIHLYWNCWNDQKNKHIQVVIRKIALFYPTVIIWFNVYLLWQLAQIFFCWKVLLRTWRFKRSIAKNMLRTKLCFESLKCHFLNAKNSIGFLTFYYWNERKWKPLYEYFAETPN